MRDGVTMSEPNNPKLEDIAGVDSPNDEKTLENSTAADASSDEDTAELPEMNEEALKQLEDMMKKLQRADDLEREVAEWKTRVLRLQTDFDNYRNRMANELGDAKTKGASDAIEAMLGTFDDVSRAIDAGVKDASSLIPGLHSVRDNFLKNLSSFGAEMVPGKGAKFDPQVHEALQVIPGAEDDVILEVYQAGFTIGGKLVRPARVIVSKAMN
jgi:molecular chaperone GrpE